MTTFFKKKKMRKIFVLTPLINIFPLQQVDSIKIRPCTVTIVLIFKIMKNNDFSNLQGIKGIKNRRRRKNINMTYCNVRIKIN